MSINSNKKDTFAEYFSGFAKSKAAFTATYLL